MSVALLLLIFALPASAGTGSAAQVMPSVPGYGRVIIDDNAGGETAARRETGNHFSQCLLRKKPKSMARVLALPTDEEFGHALSSLNLRACLDEGSLAFKPSLMRAALYTVMYRRDYAETVAAPEADTQPDWLGEMDPARAALVGFGLCVAQKDFASARRVVLAAPGTAEESAAYTALAPAMNGCLPAGTTLRFSRAMLQGIFAEALYRETAAQKNGGALVQEAAE